MGGRRQAALCDPQLPPEVEHFCRLVALIVRRLIDARAQEGLPKGTSIRGQAENPKTGGGR